MAKASPTSLPFKKIIFGFINILYESYPGDPNKASGTVPVIKTLEMSN